MENNKLFTKNEDSQYNHISFNDYIKLVRENPRSHVRTATMYIKDTFDFFGKDKEGHFNFFSHKEHDLNPVSGQLNIHKLLYKSLSAFVEEGFANKLILLVGPNGSAKSSIIKHIMKATEKYSKKDEGALFSFSWVFPYEKQNSSLGLKDYGSNNKNVKIATVIYSELRDHPLLLIPRESRREFLFEIFKDDLETFNIIKKTYLFNGDMSKKNKDIFDALLKEYNNDFDKVLSHVRIERYHISKRYSNSMVTIEPHLHVDANKQQITMDRSAQFLPAHIQSLNLFNMSGELVLGNRGIVEYSDMLKRPLDSYKYLLMTIESKTINMSGILTELDIMFMATSNEIHFDAFKRHHDFQSFKERFKIIHVPYLLSYKEELKIYETQVSDLSIVKKQKLEPHVLELLSLWVVMTRLRQIGADDGDHSKFDRNFIDVLNRKNINVFEKALFYAEDFKNVSLSEWVESGDLNIVEENLKALKKEYFGRSGAANHFGYEGSSGVSPREAKEILHDLLNYRSVVSPLVLFEELEKLANSKILEYEKDLNEQPSKSFNNNQTRIKLLKKYMQQIFDNELRDALDLTDSIAYEDFIAKYVLNIKALINNESLFNTTTKKHESPSIELINSFENRIKLQIEPVDFRSMILSKIGAFRLNYPNEKIQYTYLFEKEILNPLKRVFIEEQNYLISKILSNIDTYFNQREVLSKETSDLISKTIDNLKKIGYSEITIYEMMKKKINYAV